MAYARVLLSLAEATNNEPAKPVLQNVFITNLKKYLNITVTPEHELNSSVYEAYVMSLYPFFEDSKDSTISEALNKRWATEVSPSLESSLKSIPGSLATSISRISLLSAFTPIGWGEGYEQYGGIFVNLVSWAGVFATA